MRISWIGPEFLEGYSSGGANHNRIIVNYLNKQPDVDKVTVIRYPIAVQKVFMPLKTIQDEVELYTPQFKLKIKDAINSFKKSKYKLTERIKFGFLRLALKLKRLSTFDPSKIEKADAIDTFVLILLSLQKPYPNPFLKTFANCIEKTKPDIIQSQMEFLSIGGALAREKAKGLFSIHYEIEGGERETEENTIMGECAKRNLEALYWLKESGKVDRYIPVSEAVGENLAKHGIKKDKMKIIHSPVIVENFPEIDKQTARERLNLPKDKKIILSVGRMTGGKCYQDIIEILRRFPKDIMFYIKQSRCTTDDLLDTSKEVKSLIKKYKLTDRVIINHEYMPYEEMANVYSACDVSVFPFIDEPFGMCCIESLASGKPMIVYDSGNFPNFITNKNGFVVPPRNIDALYEKTKILLDDEKLAIEMGQRGKEIANKYDINVIGEQYIELYREYI